MVFLEESPVFVSLITASPPLSPLLTIFQFTQSALPSSLAAALPCDANQPVAAQAHLVPCEAGACSTISLQQQVAMATHYHSVSVRPHLVFPLA